MTSRLIFIFVGTVFLFLVCIRTTCRLIREWKKYDIRSKIFNLILNILCYIFIGYLLYDSQKVRELYHHFVD